MSDTAFQEFIHNIETFIISQSQIGEQTPAVEDSEEEIDQEITDDFGEDEWDF